MISYHFLIETMKVFSQRLTQPFILYDEQTKAIIEQFIDYPLERQINVAQILKVASSPVSQEKLPFRYYFLYYPYFRDNWHSKAYLSLSPINRVRKTR